MDEVIASTSKTELSAKEKLNQKIQRWKENHPHLIEKICKNCKKTNTSHKVNGNHYYCDNLCQKIFYRKQNVKDKNFDNYQQAVNEVKAKFLPLIEVSNDWNKIRDVETLVKGKTFIVQQIEL